MMIDEGRYRMCDSFGDEMNFTEDQKKCVDYDGKSVLVIKGTAGSGKSMMVIKRAIEFRKKIIANDTKENVIIFTYNKSLKNGILEVLESNSIPVDDGILSVYNADGYLSSICKKLGLIPRGETPRYDKYDRYGGNGYRKHDAYDYNAVGDEERLEIVESILKELSSKSKSAYLRRDPVFWRDEILWMYQNGIVDSDDAERYMSLKREGRCKKYNTRLGASGRKVSLTIFDRYNYELMTRNKFEWDRVYAILLRDHAANFDTGYKFDYMLIDEAQDLSLVKMLLLKSLSKGEINIAMDRNQSLYGHRWSFKNDLDFIPHVKTLQVMHRGTKEIDDFSQDLKKIDDTLLEEEDHYENETSTRVSNVLPKIVRCASPDSEVEFIVNEVKHLSEQKSNTAILCLDHKHLIMYQDRLRNAGISSEYFKEDGFTASSAGVKLITVYSAKGLGFVNVIIPNFEEGVYPRSVESVINSLQSTDADSSEYIDPDDAIAEAISDSRRLAYVGITRAKGNVILTYSGEPSRFIKEFEPEHYVLLDEEHKPTVDARIGTVGRYHRVREVIHSELENVESSIDDDSSKDNLSNIDDYTKGPHSRVIKKESEDALIDIIEEHGIEYIDRRPKGALWIIQSPVTDDVVSMLNSRGFVFKFSPGGSRSTGHRPAYYYEGY